MSAKDNRAARTRGCELKEVDVEAILTEHVPMAKCTADKLFKFKPKLKWDSCAEWRSILSAILDSSGGRIPLQKTWHLQVRRWLAKQGKVWAWMDSENAAYGLRHMLQTMLKRKQCHGRPPHRFEHLSSVLEKMHIEISENEGEPEASEEDEECILSPVVAETVSCYEVSSASSDGEGQVPLEVVSAESLDRLEKMLYPTTPPKPKRIRAKSPTPFSTPPKMPPLSCPSFAGIDDVVAMSLRMVHEKPPLPSSYRAMSAARKKLKTKGKKRARVRAQRSANDLQHTRRMSWTLMASLWRTSLRATSTSAGAMWTTMCSNTVCAHDCGTLVETEKDLSSQAKLDDLVWKCGKDALRLMISRWWSDGADGAMGIKQVMALMVRWASNRC